MKILDLYLKGCLLVGTWLVMALSAHGQTPLNLTESPFGSGFYTNAVSDALTATGTANGKTWSVELESGDRLTVAVETDRGGTRPKLRLRNSVGANLVSHDGDDAGEALIQNYTVTTPGSYSIHVFTDNLASPFRLRVDLGRGFVLESEPNDTTYAANLMTLAPATGGFSSRTAGSLKEGFDFYSLGHLAAGNAVNVNLELPVNSSLLTGDTEMALLRRGEDTPVTVTTNPALNFTIAEAGDYVLRLRVKPGLSNQALRFDGVDDHVNLANPTVLRQTGDQTIEMWIKPESFAARSNPWSKANGGEGSLTIDTSGAIVYNYGTSGSHSNPSQTFTSTKLLRLNEWNHVALVRRLGSEPKRLFWYLNGRLVTEANATYGPAVAGALDAFLGNGSVGRFRGLVDEVRVWNTARSGVEIAAAMGLELSGTEPGLVACYNFEEGTGTALLDKTANDVDGTVAGTAVWQATGGNTFSSARGGLMAQYVAVVTVTDAAQPTVTSTRPLPVLGHFFEGVPGLIVNSGNMTDYRSQTGTSFNVQVTGGTGNVYGTGTYRDDSVLSAAVRHAGLLGLDETGVVTVTMAPAQLPYVGSPQNGVTSQGATTGQGSYTLSAYTGPPVVVNAVYDGVRVDFSEFIEAATLKNSANVILTHAGADGSFGTADDFTHPLTTGYDGLSRSAYFKVENAPLQPGLHRLRLTGGVVDRGGNALVPSDTQFTVLPKAPYAVENRNNNTLQTATPMGTLDAALFDRSFTYTHNIAAGTNMQRVRLLDLNGDGLKDAIVTAPSVNQLRVYQGNADGSFSTTSTNYATGNNPWALELIDFDLDGRLDVAVTCHDSDQVRLFRNAPGGTLTPAGTITVGDGPVHIVQGHFNGDSRLDLAVANTNTGAAGRSLSILLADGSGSFVESRVTVAGNNFAPYGLAAGDVNKDGFTDLLAGDTETDRLVLFLGKGDGTFQTPTNFAIHGVEPTCVSVADFDHDTNLDVMVGVQTSTAVSVLKGDGNGGFGAFVSVELGSSATQYFAETMDVDADGWADLVVPRSNGLVVLYNSRATAAPGFTAPARYVVGNLRSAALQDVNADGRVDFVCAEWDSSRIRVLLGNGRAGMTVDPVLPRLSRAYGRGHLVSGDIDWFSFTLESPKHVLVAAEPPHSPSAAQILYHVYDMSGTERASFYSSGAGRALSAPLELLAPGKYYVTVTPSQAYTDEYRFRVSAFDPPTTLEVESNNTVGEARRVALTAAVGRLTGAGAGSIATGDTVDHWLIGNLAAGAKVTLDLRIPQSSPLEATLALLKNDGTVVATSAPGSTQLVYDVVAGQESSYVFRVTDAATTRGLHAEYLVDVLVEDLVAPLVTSSSLPTAGSTVTYVNPAFTLQFSEDMQPNTVTDAANYNLRSAGPDGSFNTADDVQYTVQPQPYSTGLSASFSITDGPLQPGSYRFTAGTGLLDKFNNPLVAYTQLFTVAGVPGYVLEGRDNNSMGTADSLSGNPNSAFDGSFSQPRFSTTGTGPWGLQLYDLDGDGHKEAIVAIFGADLLAVYPGRADGTFGTAVTYPTGTDPWDVEMVDVNADSRPDVVISCAAVDQVRVFLNPGNGTLQPGQTINVGDVPVHMVKGNFNGDAFMDLAVANSGTSTGGRSVSILLGNGTGGFTESKVTVTGQTVLFHALTAGDFNGDGRDDLAVGDHGQDALAVFLNNGSGSFGAPTFFPLDGTDPNGASTADFDGDGKLDLVVCTHQHTRVNVLKGNGNGTFQPFTTVDVDGDAVMYYVETPDLNGDGRPDLLVSRYNGVTVCYNMSDSSGIRFTLPIRMSQSDDTGGVAASDVNGDGRIDIVACSYNLSRLYVWTGNNTKPLADDGAVAGLRHGSFRGYVTSGDEDWYSFSALADDRLFLITETLEAQINSSLNYELFSSTGTNLGTASINNDGYGTWTATLRTAGTYYIRVSRGNATQQEYRVRLTLARPPTWVEVEDNDSIAAANTPPLTLAAGELKATILGVNMPKDSSGDYFNLGNLSVGTQVNITVAAPQSAISSLVSQQALEMKHRWSFGEATGATQFTDSVTGTPSAHLRGTGATVENGAVRLPGGSSATVAYIDLPNGILSSRTGNATLEGWASINSSQNWSRLFDFGTGTAGEITGPGGNATGVNFFFLSAENFTNLLSHRFNVNDGRGEQSLDMAVPYSQGQQFHFAVVYRSRGAAGGTVQYFRNGMPMGTLSTHNRLTAIQDVNNWLGRSQWTANGNTHGSFSEFRVWDGAFSEAQAAAHTAAGPDTVPAPLAAAFGAVPRLTLYKANGQQVASAAPGSGALQFTLGAEDASSYYLRVQNQERSTSALYQTQVVISDTAPPFITSNSLPAEGSTVTFPPPVFTLGFSEDMNAVSVRNAAHYELRNAGANGVFDDGDDHTYTLTPGNYTAGLTNTMRIMDGPLQAGKYRFTVGTGLKDLFERPMLATHVRTFTIEGVPGYITEDRDNGSLATADPLSPGGTPGGGFDGSYQMLPKTGSGGAAPISMQLLDLNGDGRQDLVIANRDSNNVVTRLGNGNGTFGTPTAYDTGAKPHYLAQLDFNKDGRMDVVVPNLDSDNVSLFRNNGDGTLTAHATLNAGDGALSPAAGDFNGDGNPDFVVTNHNTGTNGRCLSLYLGDGLGGFTHSFVGAGLTPAWRPYHAAVADFDGNGLSDIAAVNHEGNDVLVFLATGSGAFSAPVRYVTDQASPTAIAVADFNGDFKADLAVSFLNKNHLKTLLGNGDGSFQVPQDWALDDAREQSQLRVGDLNGDGYPDLLAPRNGSLVTRQNRASPVMSFHGPAVWGDLGYLLDVAVADLDGDGRRDLIALSYSLSEVAVFKGQGGLELKPDSLVAGVRHGYVRGHLDTSADVDYYQFSGKGGDRVVIAAETGDVATSGFNYIIYDHRGQALMNSASISSDGFVYTPPYTLPYDGRFYVGVHNYWTNTVEYRFRITQVEPQIQLEVESNNSLASSTTVNFGAASGLRSAKVFGHLAGNDSLGDFWALGNLASGTQINLTLNRPENSTFLTGTMRILNSAGVEVATSGAGNASATHTVAAGADGAYYVHVAEALANRKLHTIYQINLALTDALPPQVTGTSLPAEGSTSQDFIKSFTLNFNEDMMASSVMQAGSYNLRGAGPDQVLGTSDDVTHTVTPASYSSGLVATYNLAQPLPTGQYRLTVSGLKDTYGNNMASSFVRQFTLAQMPGFTSIQPGSNSAANATVLPQVEDPAGLVTGTGRGRRFATADVHFWAFTGTAGQKVSLDVELVGASETSNMTWSILRPDQTSLWSGDLGNNDQGSFGLRTLDATGIHYLQISSSTWSPEYRFRLSLINPVLATAEVEPNNSVATATPLTLTPAGAIPTGRAAGIVHTTTDLDYFRLGTIPAGKTVFVSAALPASAQFLPVVAIYNSSGVFVSEVNGTAGDGSAEVRINTAGDYYLLVRSTGGTGGYMSQYVAEVQVHDTSAVTIPNLRVTAVQVPPQQNLKSGDLFGYKFVVSNVGSVNVTNPSWSDRLVLSSNLIFGDADDSEVGVFVRNGVLNAGASYTVEGTANLPAGAVGNYYLIARTDIANQVDEVILENDNTSATEATFAVTLAPYPDLVVQNLAVTGPVEDVFSLTWNVANTGNLGAPAGFRERIRVVNSTTGAVVMDELRTPGPVAQGASLARTATVAATAAGVYRVTITADAQNDVYEHNGVSHVVAEANDSQVSFNILQYWNIAVSTADPGRGSVVGGGKYLAGSPVTVTATPNTSALPYQFIRWLQNGSFVSANPTYTFQATADRALVAEFALPTHQISAVVSPAGSGTVTGGGFFAHGSNATLTATTNPGYVFSRWEENGSTLGTQPVLVVPVTGVRVFQAVFAEANPTHVVVTATQPAGLGTTTGAGTFNNGQSSAFSASAAVEDGDDEYVFEHWKLNGVFFGSSRQFTKVFTTLDAGTMNFTAHYVTRTLKPVVTQVISNYGTPIRAADDVQFTLTFDRAMRKTVNPVLALQSVNAPAAAVMPAGGTWISDTEFRSVAVAFGSSNGGAYSLHASAATDAAGRVMEAASVYNFDVDTTPPVNPVPVLGSTTPDSATISWQGYAAPADLNAFRLYLHDGPFTSTAGLASVGGAAAGARSYVFNSLQPDTPYFAAVVAVDAAGNASPVVTALPVTLASTVPPPVTFVLSSPAPDRARLDWSAYSTTALVGFKGWRVYAQETAFTDVTALTPLAQLGAQTKTHELPNLDRSKTYHIAVVGYNRLEEFNPAVTPQVWHDPLAGEITSNLTLGSANASQTIDLLQSMVVKPGATLTVLPGTTLRFAAGKGLTVEGGLVAEGTPLLPINFTASGEAPAKGHWNGITVTNATPATKLAHVWIRHGRGLQITGGTSQLGPVFAVWNEGQGLGVSGSADIELAGSYFVFNDRGVRASGNARAAVTGSVIKTNSVLNAEIEGLNAILSMTGNWWGSSLPADIAAGVSSGVSAGSPLAGEPVLAAALATADGRTSIGTRTLPLALASANATAYRLSEDSLFPGVLWQNVFQDGETNAFSPQPFAGTHQLSSGAGLKTVYAQFRSVTGQTSAAIPVDVTLITAGPAIQTFSLTDGQVVTRPLLVTGSVTAALGLDWVRFYAGEELVASASGSGSLNVLWDIRSLAAGPVRARLVARDRAGNESSREVNLMLNPQPPPAPVITAPMNDTVVAAATVTVSGTAEADCTVRLTRNGQPQGSITASATGTFSFASVAVEEGSNTFVATAEDVVGTRASAPVRVERDSGPPAAVVLEAPPVYDAFRGLILKWKFATSGERPVKYKVFWHTAPFTTTAQASGQSDWVNVQAYTLSTAPDGDVHIAVVGYDAAGNASALSNQIAYRLDRTAPVFSISYDRTMPAGPGAMTLVVTSNEPLAATPLLTVKLNGLSVPFSVPLTKTSSTSYTGVYNVTQASARTGPVVVNIAGQDLTGNRFSGSPGGTALSFDVTPPTATLSFDRPLPVKTVSEADPSVSEDVNVTFNLTMSEEPKPGTTPNLKFTPPIGPDITPVLSGSGQNWTGSLVLTSSMGKGQGQFVFNATDTRDNVGSSVTPNQIELYNTEHPNAPGIPVNLRATTLAGGRIRIQWNPVADAQSYRIYREAGNSGVTPTVLVASGVAGTEWTDEDVPEDGIYRYAIRAFRVSIEGAPSGTLNALSDRTPPNVPRNLAVTLTTAGLRILWDAPASGPAPHRYHVYRNNEKIQTVNTPQPVLDFPQKGLLQYQVAASDDYGNESRTEPVPFEFFVNAVTNLVARVNQGQPTVLTWTFADPTGTGYHVYRNGIRQNTAPIPLATMTYTDLLPLPPAESVEYRVTAVDDQAREGAPRTVRVLPVTWSMRMNPDSEGTAQVSRTNYFDNYRLTVNNNDATTTLRLGSVQVSRTLSAGAVTAFTHQDVRQVASASSSSFDVPVPAPEFTGQTQNIELSVNTEPNEGGAVVSYAGRATGILPAVEPPLMVEMGVLAPPVAGGLAKIKARLYNRGYTPVEVVLGRQTGQQAGDLYIQVLDESGTEISRKAFHGLGTPGLVIRPNGDAYVAIAAGASVEVTVDDVSVPIVLAESGRANFRAIVGQVFSGLGTANERVSGPLSGTLQSTVIETPYYGEIQTAKDIYSGDEPIVITGKAIDRASTNPQGNVRIRLGFAARGAVWYEDVLVDANGNFTFSYTPFPGFAGELTIWAAHPDVFDVLFQKTIRIYRIYSTPSFGDIRMSKNDHLDFTLNILNPSELLLNGISLEFSAYRLEQDGSRTPISGIDCYFKDGTPPATFATNRRTPVNLRMEAEADVPDLANIEITLKTAQGASAKFQGLLKLMPAVPVLSMTSPRQGFVDVTVNRGDVISQQVTVQNLGTRALTAVELIPPKTVPWMQVNLPLNAAGNVNLPNLEVGDTFNFTVAFVPPPGTPQAYVEDVITIRGANAVDGFDFNIFALVSSDSKGEAKFHVENFLGQEIPNASVRLRNSLTGQEAGPFTTDSNGDATFPELTEGQYSWQVTASGHTSASGSVNIVPAQTAMVEPVLQRSLVTVTFQVRPVPFTDRYEIVIEQTFETFVPAPVLVMTPPKFDFTNAQPGFETTVVYELKNHGLVKVFNVDVTGSYGGFMTMEPLIDFIPELLPQQTVQIPCRLRLGQIITSNEAGGCDESIDDWLARRTNPPQVHPDGYVIGGPSPTIGNVIGGYCPTPNLADFLNGISAISSMGASGCFQSQSSGSLGTAAAVALAAASVYETVTSIPGKLSDVVMQVAAALGQCAAAHYGPSRSNTTNNTNNTNDRPNRDHRNNYGAGGSGCFTADTPVKLADGREVAIASLKPGDELATGPDPRETAKLTHLYTLESDTLLGVSLKPRDLPAAAPHKLRVTGEHLVWRDGSGWTAARDLRPGDWLHDEEGHLQEITSIVSIPGTHKVYTLQLKGGSTFYADGILVQDLCGGLYMDEAVLSKLQPVQP